MGGTTTLIGSRVSQKEFTEPCADTAYGKGPLEIDIFTGGSI